MRAPADANIDELKKKARRRLVGAIVLALAAAVFVPMLLESDERPLGDDVSVRIPPVDQGKFVNRLNSPPPAAAGKTPANPAAAPAQPDAANRSDATPAKTTDDAAARVDDRAPVIASSATTAAGTIADTPAAASATATPAPAIAAEQRAPKDTSVAPAAQSNAKPKPEPAVATETRTASAPVTAKATVATAPAAKSAHGEFVVQLAAFSDDKGANALANRLKRGGHPAFTEPVSTARGTLWRVRVGPYASRDEANAARDKLKREGQSGIVAARTS